MLPTSRLDKSTIFTASPQALGSKMVFPLEVTLIKEVNITRSGRLVITKLKASHSKKKMVLIIIMLPKAAGKAIV